MKISLKSIFPENIHVLCTSLKINQYHVSNTHSSYYHGGLKLKGLFCIVCAMTTMVPVFAIELPSWLNVGEKGIVKIENTSLSAIHFTPEWFPARSEELANAKYSNKNGTVTVSGKLGPVNLNETIIPIEKNAFRFEVIFTSAAPSYTKELTLHLPIDIYTRTISVDGRQTSLPSKYDDKNCVPLKPTPAHTFSLVLNSGSRLTVTGNFVVKVQDDRKFKLDRFSVRFILPPLKGMPATTKFSANFQLEPLESSPVDLSTVVNMGFRDEIASDGKGGWTDQGPQNDLRMMKSGTLAFGGIDFTILDPAINGERSVLVLGKNFLQQATVKTPKRGRWLSLLHALAWPFPVGRESAIIGEIVVTYSNNTKQVISIENGRDISNWWSPMHFENSIIAWTAETPTSRIGIGFSQFKLKEEIPIELTFYLKDHNCYWLVLAANISDGYLPCANLRKTIHIVEDKDWVRLDSSRDIVAESPLDFSGMLDAPAGKYGAVQVSSDGHFTFANAPEKRLKFVGTNLCSTANFLSHHDADKLAERLARMGFNAVRFHHHDGWLVKNGIKNSTEIDMENLDKIEYLFAALKKRGIYITTDVYCSRQLRTGDNIPEPIISGKHPEIKLLLPISSAVRQNWKVFARNWLTHRNPYTGLTWAEDPAFYMVSLVNEDCNYWWIDQFPEIGILYSKEFPRWMAKHYPRENVGPSSHLSNRRYNQYLYDCQYKSSRELANFLKEDLNVIALQTDMNMDFKVPLTLIRNDLEIVDNHKYHDHPHFPVRLWNLPMQFCQRSSIDELGDEVPCRLFPSRIFGKPYSITEYKFCVPNLYRAEGGPLIGGYAALQGWDALYQFAWAHSRESINMEMPGGTFDYANEPLAQLSDRLTMFLFRRGDVRAAEVAFAYRVPLNFWDTILPVEYPDEFFKLGLISRIGSIVKSKNSPGVVILDDRQARMETPLPVARINSLRKEMFEKGIAISDTGELRLDSVKHSLCIMSPRSECVTVTKGDLTARRLTVRGAKISQTVSVSSLDEKTIGKSSRILAFHMTNVIPSKTKFSDERMVRMDDQGALPFLVRRDKVEVTLMLDGLSLPKVEALKLNGSAHGEIISKFENGKLSFIADPGAFRGGVMVYLISR